VLKTRKTASVTAIAKEVASNRNPFRCVPILSMLLLFAGSAYAATAPQPEDEIYSALLGWATNLSGYPRPAVTPKVRFVSQEFFNENACHHRQCRVWGWYPNTGGHTVYVHEAIRALIADASDDKSLLAASIIVHEFTHYLQAVNRQFAPYRCDQALELEREAYGVQSAYIVAYGRYLPIGVSMHSAGCEGSASETNSLDATLPDDQRD
jgi:hypothetical protein